MKTRYLLLCFSFYLCASPLVGQDAQQPASTRVSSIETLVELLKKENIEYQANSAEQYVVVPVQRGGLKSAQVIRWAARDGFIHFIQVIPIQVPPEHLPAVESAIVRINHSYPVPGLGMNHDNNTTYFRFTVPILPRGYLEEREVKEYFSFCVNQAVQLQPTLAAIASGEIPGDKALDYHRTRIQESLGPLGAWQREFAGSKWVLKINAKGEVTLEKDGAVVVDSLITVEKDQMTFDDVTGVLAHDEKGIYKFKVEGKTMTFTAVEDSSEGRQKVLSGGAWSR